MYVNILRQCILKNFFVDKKNFIKLAYLNQFRMPKNKSVSRVAKNKYHDCVFTVKSTDLEVKQ